MDGPWAYVLELLQAKWRLRLIYDVGLSVAISGICCNRPSCSNDVIQMAQVMARDITALQNVI